NEHGEADCKCFLYRNVNPDPAFFLSFFSFRFALQTADSLRTIMSSTIGSQISVNHVSKPMTTRSQTLSTTKPYVPSFCYVFCFARVFCYFFLTLQENHLKNLIISPTCSH